MANGNTKPIKKFGCGGVSAAVWKNNRIRQDGSELTTHSVTLDRRYKDKDGVWQSSSSLQSNDVPKAILVLSKAYECINLSDDGAQGDVESDGE